MFFLVDKAKREILGKFNTLPLQVTLPNGDIVMGLGKNWDTPGFALLEASPPEASAGKLVTKVDYAFDGTAIRATATEIPEIVIPVLTKEERLQKLLAKVDLTIEDLRELLAAR